MQVSKIPEITTVAEGVAVAYLHGPNRVRGLWGESNGHQEANIWINPTEELGGKEKRAVLRQRRPASGKGELNILIGWQGVRTQEFLVF